MAFFGAKFDILKPRWLPTDGQFRWPKIEDGVMLLSAAQLSALLEGLDWGRVRAAKDTPAPRLPG